MQQFQVPQFIEIEDKIFGPLTLKQFLYLAGGGAVVFFLWTLLPFWLFVITAPFAGAFFGSLAFLTINGRPFVIVMSSALSHYTKTRLFLWKRREKRTADMADRMLKAKKENLEIPALSESKLKELSWVLDITEHLKR